MGLFYLVGHVPQTGLFSGVSGELVEKSDGSDVIFETHHLEIF